MQERTLSTRREFLQTTAVISGAAISGAAMLATSGVRPLFAGGDDTIQVGVIGCGGRGTGAAANCLDAAPGIRITALGDLFEDRLSQSYFHLNAKGGESKQVDVPEERRFTGFDAYQKVIASDVDLVILATPPGFRPMHLAAAIEAGKHVFMEKPVAVDPAGVRSVIESAKRAKAKGLGIVAGTQRRHQASYLEVMKRIHDGAIGKIVAGECSWNQGGLWVHQRQPAYSDMEWQIRNWLYFTWLSGDHIVEQHVHNLDVINWALGSPPVKALGMGGRQVRTQPEYGNIFDHFAVEYEYPGGVRISSHCRQIAGTATGVGERLVGTRGIADPSGRIEGESPYRFRNTDPVDPYVQEHTDLIESIRAGEPLNEGQQIAESTLTAIMGRMAAYTGKAVEWDFALNSSLDLLPREWAFAAHPVDPVAIPGRTPLV